MKVILVGLGLQLAILHSFCRPALEDDHNQDALFWEGALVARHPALRRISPKGAAHRAYGLRSKTAAHGQNGEQAEAQSPRAILVNPHRALTSTYPRPWREPPLRGFLLHRSLSMGAWLAWRLILLSHAISLALALLIALLHGKRAAPSHGWALYFGIRSSSRNSVAFPTAHMEGVLMALACWRRCCCTD